MADYKTKYSVYGHYRSKRGEYKEEQYLGYVKDFNSVYAREQAKDVFGKAGYIVTKVYKDRGAFGDHN